MSDTWFRIGHTTDADANTGCTAIIFEHHVPAVVDVRGGAPGTRETTLLSPGRRGMVDAIAFSGGSAFGLSTADGVMRYLSEQGRGLPTLAGPVPLVPAAIIYDLANGPPVYPTAEWGYRAAAAARPGEPQTGAVGAGTGATVAKLGGTPSPAGLGFASIASAAGLVSALVVVNAVGDVVRPDDGRFLRRAIDPEGRGRSGLDLLIDGVPRPRAGENTTIGCVFLDAAIDRDGLTRAAVAAHNGLARCIVPAHTAFDGDTIFVVARETGLPDPSLAVSAAAAASRAVEAAIVDLFDDSPLSGRH